MKTIFISAILVAVLTGCAGYVPGRQSYWDAQVKEMCARDGYVRIFEKVSISKKELDKMILTKDGAISLKMKDLVSAEDVVYLESIEKNIVDGNPRVRRTEWLVIRQSDKKVVASWNSYGRVGGDIPTGLAHDSSFRCPEWDQTWAELKNLFLIKEN